MAARSVPTLVTCPGICGRPGTTCGEQVAAHGFGDFNATQVKVDACSRLIAQGWVGPQLVEWKSRADYLLPAQPVQPAGLRHRDGLVVLGGAR